MIDLVLRKLLVLIILLPLLINRNHQPLVNCELVNRPPYFISGSGDMSRFSLSESTPVDSPVYQLKGKSNLSLILTKIKRKRKTILSNLPE